MMESTKVNQSEIGVIQGENRGLDVQIIEHEVKDNPLEEVPLEEKLNENPKPKKLSIFQQEMLKKKGNIGS